MGYTFMFEKAVKLLFPDLKKTDPRFHQITEYLRMKYFEDFNYLCVLCAIPNARAFSFRNFYSLCEKLQLDPQTREVVLSSGKVFFTEKYWLTPTLVYEIK